VKAPPFDYVLAGSVPDVHRALEDARRSGLEAKVLAGGQSLVPLMNFRLARPDRLVDINRLDELRYLEVEDASFRVGALCRHVDIERTRPLMSRVGALADALPLVGHPSIRARGTVVGSLAHGDPLAEWISLALLLDATLTLSSSSGTRVVEATGWLEGYLQTAAGDDDLVEEASFTLPAGEGAGEGSAFVELARRHGDFCLVSAAAAIALGGGGTVARARLVIAGVRSVPFRAEAVEEALIGEPPIPETWERVTARLGHIDAQGDLHATAAYRRHVAAVVARRALASAAARAVAEPQ
jgi:carbon-monoxide dehydrogenase medium subunit